MQVFPDLQLGFLNGWIPLAVMFLTLGVLSRSFPKDVRQRLYDRSGWSQEHRRIATLSLPFGLTGLVLVVLSPLKIGEPVFFIGAVVYLVGTVSFVMALLDFRNAPPGKPATSGLYRWSRNPQIFSSALAVLSTGLMVGSLVAILLLSVRIVLNHFRVLGEERACLSKYGDEYRAYMKKVPRYILY